MSFRFIYLFSEIFECVISCSYWDKENKYFYCFGIYFLVGGGEFNK